jgi:hypothetical protein
MTFTNRQRVAIEPVDMESKTAIQREIHNVHSVATGNAITGAVGAELRRSKTMLSSVVLTVVNALHL